MLLRNVSTSLEAVLAAILLHRLSWVLSPSAHFPAYSMKGFVLHSSGVDFKRFVALCNCIFSYLFSVTYSVLENSF